MEKTSKKTATEKQALAVQVKELNKRVEQLTESLAEEEKKVTKYSRGEDA